MASMGERGEPSSLSPSSADGGRRTGLPEALDAAGVERLYADEWDGGHMPDCLGAGGRALKLRIGLPEMRCSLRKRGAAAAVPPPACWRSTWFSLFPLLGRSVIVGTDGVRRSSSLRRRREGAEAVEPPELGVVFHFLASALHCARPCSSTAAAERSVLYGVATFMLWLRFIGVSTA